MQVTDVAVKFFRPEVSAPFVNLYLLTPKAGILNRNPPHFHPDTIEVFAVFRGHLDWTIEDEIHTLHPGDVIVIPPKVVHGAVDANLQPSEVVGLHIAPEELPVRVQANVESLGILRTRNALVLDTVRRVYEEQKRRTPLTPDVVAALGTLLISTLLDISVDEEIVENSRIIRKAQRALMDKFGPRPTVSDVAARLGISTVWLNRLFIRETGASPGDWARARRLAESKRLLEANQLTTTEIALELGYSSGQVFATTFRKECGMTPSEYRSLHGDQVEGQQQEPVCQSMRIVYEDMDEVIQGLE
jgi:AraC-like DNA-binding protein/mannose-6-phosphate isomerase-like protein (cupin superfamily)